MVLFRNGLSSLVKHSLALIVDSSQELFAALPLLRYYSTSGGKENMERLTKQLDDLSLKMPEHHRANLVGSIE